MAMPRKKEKKGLKQNTPEWDEWRLTGIGASSGYDAMNMSKALYDQYLAAKVPASIESVESIARGNRLEPEARELIEMETMESLEPVCMSRGIFNMSADAMNESRTVGHEIKCPELKQHLAHIRGEIPHRYYHQCQQSMYVTGLKEWFFHSFCPEHEEQPLFSRPIKRDKKYIESMVAKCTEFWDRVLKREWPDAEIKTAELVSDVAEQNAGKAYSAPAIESDISIPAELEKRRNDLVVAMQQVKDVTSPEQAEFATDVTKQASILLKALEDARKSKVKPHNDHVKKVNSIFKEVAGVIQRGNDVVRERLLSYHEEQLRIAEEKRREQEEAERKAAEERRKAEEAEAKEKGVEKPGWLDEPEAPAKTQVPKAQVVHGTHSRSGTSMVWDYDEGSVDLSKVPVRYLMLNVKEVRKAIRDGERSISGLKIIKKTRLNVR